MKKLPLLVLALMLSVQTLSAWSGGFGVIAGYTGGSSSAGGYVSNSFHAGVTVKCPFLLGFALQPSLIYNEKGIDHGSVSNLKMGSIELPLSVQWGPDLILLRPYFEVVPFVGYNIWNRERLPDGTRVNYSWNDINRMECGVGLGGGLEVWKLQVSARYCWNFNSVYKDAADERQKAVMVSVAVIF